MYNRIDMIWAMFKVYLNNPNQIVMQGDVLADLCGNGSKDVIKICHSLGLYAIRPNTLTFGQLLSKCNII